MFAKINSGKFRPKSGEIQFPVPVKPEPNQGFEIPVQDLPEPECQKIYSGSGNKNRNCVLAIPVLKTPFRSYPTLDPGLSPSLVWNPVSVFFT